ncbi:MAG: hypothetical protein EG824_01510 [Deltaproteobacteria bacterium]|nr:hypothetical protein [Deltaproteobacteria bacterium]
MAISSSLGESRAILRLIHAASRDLNVPIVIRPHPSIPIAELYQQYDWPSNVRLSFRSTLTEDMGQVGFIAYSSSTVALEGLIHGRLPIFLDIRDVLVGDPIDNVAFKLNATSPASLVSCIRAVNAWPPEKLDSLRHQGRSYAEKYLAAPNPNLLEEMSSALQ